jgi:tetratricopeptide (TPR) repeat protein
MNGIEKPPITIHTYRGKSLSFVILSSSIYFSENNGENQGQETDLSTNLCLGLLYVKLHNHKTAIECLNKATVAPRQSDQEVLFVAYLLLADMFKQRQQQDAAIANFDQALKFIQPSASQEDAVLEIEVKLARIDCHKDEAVMAELQKLERSLIWYGSDTRAVCLKVIVYDTWARYCLMQAEYERFDYAIEQSISLKQGSLSQYHPSLAIDFIFRAQCHVQQAEALSGENADIGYIRQSHYREALASYERALEVYNLNFSNNNLEVRKIYYAVGDIMCDMDKLLDAMEKYDVAENNYSDLDDDDTQPPEGEESEESVEIWMARASMHRHLAEYHARKKAYEEAIVEMKETINLYSQQLPSSPYGADDDKTLAQDLSIILASLHHLAQCYVYLGDTMGSAQDEEDGYFIAIDIYMKLVTYNKALEKEEALLYKKVSDYYENLGESDEALEYFQKAVHLEETSVADLYKLGRLYDVCNKPDDAVKNYQVLLAHPTICEQNQLKQIIQGKLNAAQKANKSQKRQLKSASTISEETRNDHIPDSPNEFRQGATIISNPKSIDDLNRNVGNTG